MLLSEIITAECIKLRLESDDKEEVFEELIDLLVNHHNVDERGPLLDAIRERESKGTTGIGGGIAIPHAKSKNAGKPMVVLGISDEGIDYQAMDNEPVYIVFLMITQESNPTEHLKILQQIAKFTKDESFVDRIRSAASPKEVHNILTDFEDQEA
jgi:fructose-specific phosphotransferase system IIA component